MQQGTTIQIEFCESARKPALKKTEQVVSEALRYLDSLYKHFGKTHNTKIVYQKLDLDQADGRGAMQISVIGALPSGLRTQLRQMIVEAILPFTTDLKTNENGDNLEEILTEDDLITSLLP